MLLLYIDQLLSFSLELFKQGDSEYLVYYNFKWACTFTCFGQYDLILSLLEGKTLKLFNLEMFFYLKEL